MMGTDNLTSIRWTYADGTLTLHDHLDRATADAIGRIVDGLGERRQEVLVVRGNTTLRYRVPADDVVDEAAVVRPRAPEPPSPRAPEPLPHDRRLTPAPHHYRKARHAKH